MTEGWLTEGRLAEGRLISGSRESAYFGNFRAALERVRDGPGPFRLGHLLLHGLPGLLGQLDFEQVPGGRGMAPATPHDPREDVFQGLGGRPVVGRRASDDPAQEPAGPVDTQKADGLQPPSPAPRSGLRRRDPGPELDAEPAVGLIGRATGLGHRGGDLVPHVIPEAAALRGGERLLLKGTLLAQHCDQRPLVLGQVQLYLESLAHRYLKAAEVDPLMRRELLVRIPRARPFFANGHCRLAAQLSLVAAQLSLVAGQLSLLAGQLSLLVVKHKLLLGGVLPVTGTIRL